MHELKENLQIPVDLELTCSYAEFMKWLTEYPIENTEMGNKLQIRVDDIGKLFILFEFVFREKLGIPPFTGDGFTFDVISNKPLHLSGFYEYLPTKNHDQDGYSTPARDFLERVNKYFGKPQITTGKRGPTLKTIERFKMLKRLKELNPAASQTKLAMDANEVEKSSFFTADIVANIYKAMGEKWIRGDRVR